MPPLIEPWQGGQTHWRYHWRQSKWPSLWDTQERVQRRHFCHGDRGGPCWEKGEGNSKVKINYRHEWSRENSLGGVQRCLSWVPPEGHPCEACPLHGPWDGSAHKGRDDVLCLVSQHLTQPSATGLLRSLVSSSVLLLRGSQEEEVWERNTVIWVGWKCHSRQTLLSGFRGWQNSSWSPCQLSSGTSLDWLSTLHVWQLSALGMAHADFCCPVTHSWVGMGLRSMILFCKSGPRIKVYWRTVLSCHFIKLSGLSFPVCLCVCVYVQVWECESRFV